MERVTTWRSSQWARWLGWTAVFGVVVGVCGLAYRWRGTEDWSTWSLVLLVPPLATAFLIGARFPSQWWWAGPLVALFLVGMQLRLIPFDDDEGPPGLLVILLVLCTQAARAGVRYAQRPDLTRVGFTKSSHTDDASP
jgi:hypothetical protein